MDYEDQRQQKGFNLKVRVSDGLFEAYTKVHLDLEDINDNPPECHEPKEKIISEASERGAKIATIKCEDKDANDEIQ